MIRGTLILLAVSATPLVGQRAPATHPLPAPSVVLDHEFTRVAGLRELADGRVLVTDPDEKKLFVVDWATRGVRPIGREGRGPGEFSHAGELFALAGDSTLLVDILAGRWLLLYRDSIVETVAADAPAIRAGARTPRGADIRGGVYATRSMGTTPGGRGPLIPSRTDSTLLVRVDRRDGSSDTLITVASRPGRITFHGPARAPTGVEIVMNPLAVGDQPVVFPDGSVAVARVNPYRVDWVAPDGKITRGAPLPFERHAVNDREKRAVLAREAEARGREPRDPAAVPDWPTVLPPFRTGAARAAHDGRLWIERLAAAGAERTTYDVVDRAGALVARVTTGLQERIVAVGRESVYTVLTDDDGIQRLRRHPLPPLPRL